MHRIHTECVLAASPARVWEVLADLERYSEWNPLNIEAHGEARPGARVRMVFRNLAARPGKVIRQTVTLVAAEPGVEIAWAARIPFIFTGRHGFRLVAEGEGTRVIHTEVLSGLLPASWSEERIRRDFLPAYEAVNVALARRLGL